MTSYFTNSYIPDLRNGTPDHYQTCTTPVNGATPDPSCDPRNSIHHYGNHHNGQGGQPLYPRFPPYDRMAVGPGGPGTPVQYYQQQGGGAGQLMENQYRPPSPPPSVNPGIPMGGHVVNLGQTPGGYSSCKMQQQQQQQQQQVPQVPQHQSPGANGPPLGVVPPVVNHNHNQHPGVVGGPPLSPDPVTGQSNHVNVVNVNHMNNPQNGNHHGSHNHMGMYNNMGGAPPQPPQHPMNQMHGQPPQQQPPPQLPQQQMGHHPNQNHQNPHQSPQQQNSPASVLPSPLYPWMRSQFEIRDTAYDNVNVPIKM
ncbi:Homeotic protein antennapedia, partial [Orchesella cincta]